MHWTLLTGAVFALACTYVDWALFEGLLSRRCRVVFRGRILRWTESWAKIAFVTMIVFNAVVATRILATRQLPPDFRHYVGFRLAVALWVVALLYARILAWHGRELFNPPATAEKETA